MHFKNTLALSTFQCFKFSRAKLLALLFTLLPPCTLLPLTCLSKLSDGTLGSLFHEAILHQAPEANQWNWFLFHFCGAEELNLRPRVCQASALLPLSYIPIPNHVHNPPHQASASVKEINEKHSTEHKALERVTKYCYIVISAFHGNNQAINMMAHLCGLDWTGNILLSDSQHIFSV